MDGRSMNIGPPAEGPEKKPQPIAMIPYGRDPDFVDPGSLVDRVHKLCSRPSARLALVGFGGVGSKSHIAIEYTYWIREQSPRTWVFWVHASDIVRYEQGLRDIAELVKIPRRRDPAANIFQLVGNWFQDQQEERWILILDNVDDDEYLHKPVFKNSKSARNDERAEPPNNLGGFSEKSALEFLPRTPNGSIIITTRNKRIALNLVNECDIITVKPSESHAVALLHRKLQDKVVTDEMSLRSLARELEWIALAIVQAATFIARHFPRCTVSQYLHMFRESNEARLNLLRRQTRLLHRDGKADNSIIVTLQISFESIEKENPQAMNLLSLMSFFDRQGIPDYLLHASFHDDNIESDSDIDESYTLCGPVYQREKANKQASANSNGSNDGVAPFSLSQLEFEGNVSTLKDYSFISIDPEALTFGMHGLVQLAIQEWLNTQGRLEHWKEIFIRNLYLEFPRFTDFENISRSRALFPHVQSALSHGPDPNHRLRWARLVRHASDYVLFCDKPNEAKRMTAISRKEAEDSLGWECPETIIASAFEVKALIKCEDFKTAEERCLQTIEACIKFHLETGYKIYLSFRLLLARIHRFQGSHRWAESESEYKELWKTCERDLPDDEWSITSIKADLARLYEQQDRLDEAEILLQEVIVSHKTIQTDRHQDLSNYMKDLANLYRIQGRHEEAATLLAQVLVSQEDQFGREDPRTLLSMRDFMRDFACVLETQIQPWEAMLLMKEVFEKQKMVLGLDHAETAHTADLLVDLLVKNGELEAAASLAESLIRDLDPDAHFALVSSYKLGVIYLEQGQGEKARDIKTKTLERVRQLHGPEHDAVIDAQLDLAICYEKQGQFREAEALHQHMYQVRQRSLGSEDPKTLTSLQHLVDLYFRQDGLVSKESQCSMLSQLSRSWEAVLGREDPQTLLTLFGLSLVHFSQENWLGAADLQQEILEICLRKSGNSFDSLSLLLNALVDSWEALGRDEDAACLDRHIDFISEDMSAEEIATILNSSKTLAGVLERSSSFTPASVGVYTT
ncbi:hypothetical protein AtubIFM57258_006581 [Aspergillus tubingensis]|nr:hypothetical protein AtubIFM57258_006581 [Aspergillus tubingensis]